MKTRTPTDPARLRQLEHALARVRRGADGGLALHAQLRLAILGCVHAGEWKAGDRLPPEAELVDCTGLSLGTVQRALRDLTDEGVVRRQQGSGSFVADAPHRIDDVAHCRFLGDDGQVLPVFSRVLGRRAATRTALAANHFPAGARVLRLDRVLDVNDEFEVFSRFWFDGGRFQGLATRPIEALAGTNFKQLLAQEAQLPPGGVSQTMRLVQAPAEIARAIGVDPDAWVARLDIVRHVAGATGALYVQEMYVPPTSRALVTQAP